jgi:peptide/nickel transport system permease protein
MGNTSLSVTQGSTVSSASRIRRPFTRMAKYVIAKAVVLFLTVMIGLYLTILVVNLGGYVDQVFQADVAEEIIDMIRSGAFRGMTHEATTDQIWVMRWSMEEEKGLHKPFMLRTWQWFQNSLTFNWGEGDTGWILTTLLGGYIPLSKDLIRAFLLERLPYSLLLMGSSALLLFLITIPLALAFSRRRAKFLDGLTVLLSSATSAPPWMHGIVLIFIFATLLGILPYPRFSADLMDFSNAKNFFIFLKYMTLPALSLFLSLVFQSIYTWRTFFLIYSQEDFVELGRAKGLPDGVVEKRYILRSTLPYVVTSFAMLMLGMWQNMIALEALFKWPGLGSVMLIAIQFFNTPLLLSIVTLFAYLMALTVFLLDFFYVWVDPRVRIDFGPQVRLAPTRRNIFYWLRSRRTSNMLPFPKPAFSAEQHKSPALSIRQNPPKRLRLSRGSQNELWDGLRQLLRQPSGVLGLGIILVVTGIAIYSVVALPAGQFGTDWSSASQHGVWYANPKNALPVWVNYFRKDKLPETMILDSRKDNVLKTSEVVSPEVTKVTLFFDFDYKYDNFPQDLVVYLSSQAAKKQPLVELTWLTPDGREIVLGTVKLESSDTAFYVGTDKKLQQRFGRVSVMEGLFVAPDSQETESIKGVYRLQVRGFLFESGADLDAEAILYGQVYGLAGTDDMRRDLMLPMLSGAPVALAFGFLGAIATSMLSMFIAALGVWYGGWVDGFVQRISEVVMTVPTLAVAILIFLMYSHSVWAVLGVIVILSIFGSSLKNFRAVFLQVKEAPYLEAAQTQGAGDWRIIRKYLLPRVLPVMIPQLVIMVPVYVYYEVTLAFLGISDPTLPTWGRIIYEALENQAFQLHPHRILIPVTLLLITGLGFALLGLALDRILNPRLRD